ncbi:hypothetical protein PMSD_17145 [Paenibacillus macquariensis subsp. defensor]|nr:hypothetical protein PMSD_17145 [Paenibacillus macquariensis subsp. defensor]
MNLIKDLLLQLTLIVLPMFTYHTFFAEKLSKKENMEKLVMTALWALSVIFCMSFPATYGPGYHLDLKIIPLLLGTLYSEIKTGIFLAIVVIVYRLLYFGIDIGFYITILTVLCSLPVFLYSRQPFNKASTRKKLKFVMLLSIFFSAIGFIMFCIVQRYSQEYLKILIIHTTFIVMFIWCFTILNEYIRTIGQMRIEIQELGKLQVIRDITSVFAHEIRNPMQVSRGFLQLLDEPDLPDKKKKYIALSIEELDRADEIINDLLIFAKPTTDNMYKVDVGLELNRILNITKAYSISLDVEIKHYITNDCWAYANPQKLRQCLINILKNAIESMPDGGYVWVTCIRTVDGNIEITIQDEGIGMSKEQVDRLGTPFYSLKESGTGLGMMVSYQIIRSFKGQIKVTSEKEEGTAFCILLPVVP